MFLKRVTPRTIMFSLAAMVLLIPALAATSADAEEVYLLVREVNTIEFMSGGIGESERAALEAYAEDRFNLKLTFARDSGEYLSNIIVTVFDDEGVPLVHTISNGPWFYADLPEGEYTVTAVFANEEKSKKVELATDGLAEERYRWQ